MMPYHVIAIMLGPLAVYLLISLLKRGLSPAKSAEFFRSVGWDLTGVSVGLAILAFSSSKSRLQNLVNISSGPHAGWAVLVFIFLFICCWSAVDIRFRVLDEVQRQPSRRFLWGACGWALGLGLVGLWFYLGEQA